MGTSSFLLFKREESIPAIDLLMRINKICKKEKLYFDSDEKVFNNEGKLIYTRIYVSDVPFRENYSRTLCFSVYDEPYEYQVVSFEWDDTNNEYFKAVVSDDFYDNEDLLLRFFREILRIYPKSKLWVEDEWFYTFEDLEKTTDVDNYNWCYKDPRYNG
ncbi:hypothetical protein [Paenibacillus tundrae]|uniref:Uncharacterized protein n=1 Tax=Paenibacillus tundrae TaxID=528187 RepID=A0ABT9WF21_9BACL|nr:hypothetical protein [Paenibacillus tundrae]MDQ0171879.1 hypothetical protein [Paenibacillus tundrae]